ncbi:Sulfotransferase family cytosolic 1B member 1 [Holothuria leucospilota]|uniref:Sulfotransferase family cytosolic 1B member 1 n=1 Tax=Holothuria leucospilota TaxID=206669 RepID=A0A9Q1H7B6_HOLLE|nr:Sulfotransferase family cytosolic 1B member 1 [Holothuria leucospilota]
MLLNAIFLTARFGNWCDHALGYWKHRMEGFMFFITYEEMKQDIRSVAKRLANFMDETISSEGMERIVKHSTLDGMKKTYAQMEEESTEMKISPKFYEVARHLQKGRVKKFIDRLQNNDPNDDKIQLAAIVI